MSSGWLHFDGMTWPDPDDPLSAEWALRYGTVPDRAQLNYAASVIAAYQQLVRDPVRRRNEKVSGIRAAMAAEPDPSGGPA